ncbi:MAG: flagellar hook protein FlgE [Nitrospirae bacterium]|nr:flagellar hook protein FlgE [Nitrospirota bacterium]
MLTSLFTGVSGLNANGTSLSVISDNIANMNTIGFKSSRVSFGDVLSQTLGGVSGSSQIGRGVMVGSIDPIMTQGSFETTSNGLDLAIDGNGFFIVNNNGTTAYTRAGQFSLDKNGNVINPDGMMLQGYMADASGNITGTLGNLTFGSVQSSPQITANVTLALNLDTTETAPTAAFTLDSNGDGINNDPANFNKSTTVTVYDSQGGAHDVTAYFVKTADNAWDVHYVNIDPADPTLLVDAGTQSLSFDTNGALIDDNSATAINFDFGAAVTTPQAVVFNFGTGTGETPAGTGLDGTTQFASDFAVTKLSQDGYASGSLRNVVIDDSGVMTGIFTNGQSRAIGQIALATFVSPEGLVKMGRNLYGESFDSGQPIVGAASTGGMGRVLSNSLELSNVDLAAEFVNMITSQRSFQANSRVITTSDELLQELVNLKR